MLLSLAAQLQHLNLAAQPSSHRVGHSVLSPLPLLRHAQAGHGQGGLSQVKRCAPSSGEDFARAPHATLPLLLRNAGVGYLHLKLRSTSPRSAFAVPGRPHEAGA